MVTQKWEPDRQNDNKLANKSQTKNDNTTKKKENDEYQKAGKYFRGFCGSPENDDHQGFVTLYQYILNFLWRLMSCVAVQT